MALNQIPSRSIMRKPGARMTGVSLLVLALLIPVAVRSADSVREVTELVLAPRSGPRGTTMFTELSAQQTGVIAENRYADPRMWAERHREFEVGAMGSGVAIGDYDGDGRPDIFVVNKTDSCRLFRNLGNW